MAAQHEQALSVFFSRVFGQVTPSIARQAAREGGREALKQIRDRADAGLDVNGQAFKTRTPKYMKRKRRLIGRYSGLYAADSADDYMRLSGGLMRSMKVKKISGKQTGNFLTQSSTTLDLGFTIHVTGKQQRQLDGLRKRGYDPFPLARPGSAQRKREDRAIVRRVKEVIRVRTGRGVVVDV